LRDATLTAFRRVVDLCLAEGVDCLLLAGDLTTAAEKSLRAQLELQKALQRLAEAGIEAFLVTGNHDPLSSRSAALRWPPTAHLLGPEPEHHELRRGGELIGTVSGLSHAKPEVRENLAQGLQAPASPFAIALLHCNLGGRATHEPYAPCSLDDLLNSRFDYWALGHVHAPEIVRAANPTIVYAGSPQGLDINETGPHGCYHVVVDDARLVQARFVETSAARWCAVRVDVAEVDREQALVDLLRERLGQVRDEVAGRTALVRVRLEGRAPLHGWLQGAQRCTDLAEELRDAEDPTGPCVWVESVVDDTRPLVDLERHRAGQDLLADFLRAAEQAEIEPEARAAVRAALQPLLDRREMRGVWEPDDAGLLQVVRRAADLGVDLLLPEGE